MKVQVFPADRKGVGHCRMIWPAEAAARAGAQVAVADFSARGLPIFRVPGPGGRQTLVPKTIDADVLVLQRVSNPEVLALIPAFQAKGHAVVVDLDDDLGAVHHRNAAAGAEDPRAVARACRLADLATFSTPALAARYGTPGRCAVLENCVPEAILDLPRDSDGITVGWGGWIGSHPGDLEVTYGGVAQALERTGGRFHVVGPGQGVAQALSLPKEPSDTGPLRDVENYEYEHALGQLDVGIAPLADSRFNASKSWLKPLQYAARGAVAVVSPRAEYARLTELGLAIACPDRGRSWRSQVAQLISDGARREELAAQAKAQVADEHTYEANAHRWCEAWEHALSNHRAAHRAKVAA